MMGASTPEELDSLFEDALRLSDGVALMRLFASGATLIAANEPPARGMAAITTSALDVWRGEQVYVAHPRQMVLARDIALIVTEHGSNVARRTAEGGWRYAIVHQGLAEHPAPHLFAARGNA